MSLQRRRVPRQAWRYIPKKGCTSSTVALRYISWDYLLGITEKRRLFDIQATNLDFQIANDIVVSDTHAKVYINELGASLWIHVVKDSPSVLSLGRPCNELCYYSWPTGGTPWTSSPWLQLSNRRQYHPLNSRQPRDTLSENKKWRTPCWICCNHLQKDWKNEMLIPQPRQLGVTLRMKLSQNNLVMRNFPWLPPMWWEKYSGRRYQE